MICQKCKKEIDSESKFCEFCGNKIEADAEENKKSAEKRSFFADLFETRLQKLLFLIGGTAIFVVLINSSSFDHWRLVLQSVGIAVFTFVLLIIFRNYHPNKTAILFFFAVVAMIGLYLGVIAYNKAKKEEVKRQVEENFHRGEVAYQLCLTRVFKEKKTVTEPSKPSDQCSHMDKNSFLYRLSCSTSRTRDFQVYTEEWRSLGEPYKKSNASYWEVSFMKWFMENHSDFCEEYGIDSINYFLQKKTEMVGINF